MFNLARSDHVMAMLWRRIKWWWNCGKTKDCQWRVRLSSCRWLCSGEISSLHNHLQLLNLPFHWWSSVFPQFHHHLILLNYMIDMCQSLSCSWSFWCKSTVSLLFDRAVLVTRRSTGLGLTMLWRGGSDGINLLPLLSSPIEGLLIRSIQNAYPPSRW